MIRLSTLDMTKDLMRESTDELLRGLFGEQSPEAEALVAKIKAAREAMAPIEEVLI